VLHVQGLHTVHGLRPYLRGSAPVCLPLCGGGSRRGYRIPLVRTDHLLAAHGDFVRALRQSDLSFRRPPATGPLGRYPGRTLTGKPIAASRTHQIGFIDEPAITGGVPAQPCCVDEQGREPLHPTVDSDMSQALFIQHEVICANAVSIAIFRASALQLRFECCAPSGMRRRTHVLPNRWVSGRDGSACLRSVGRGPRVMAPNQHGSGGRRPCARRPCNARVGPPVAPRAAVRAMRQAMRHPLFARAHASPRLSASCPA
jgi:hypothetical protein